MISKKATKITYLVILSIFIVHGLLISVSAHEGESHTTPSINTWKLVDWNEQSPTNWWSKGIYVQALKGSNIIYNVTNANGNFTHPNSGYFTIGNVSNIDAENNDLASSFALSIWPWMPGFVADANNWTKHEVEAKSAAAGEWLQGELKITKSYTYDFSSFKRNAIKFEYMQNSTLGNQNTTLIYDYSSGVLLHGKTAFSGFVLELDLSSSTLINETNVQAPGFEFFLPVLTLSAGYLVRKKYMKT